MPAGTLNLTGSTLRIEQGATYSLALALTEYGAPYDLTGATAEATMRKGKHEADGVAFTVVIDSPETAGTLTLTLSAEQTAALDYVAGVWDLQLTESGGTVKRLLEGTTEISLAVTHD